MHSIIVQIKIQFYLTYTAYTWHTIYRYTIVYILSASYLSAFHHGHNSDPLYTKHQYYYIHYYHTHISSPLLLITALLLSDR